MGQKGQPSKSEVLHDEMRQIEKDIKKRIQRGTLVLPGDQAKAVKDLTLKVFKEKHPDRK